jgi:hypothetical protein
MENKSNKNIGYILLGVSLALGLMISTYMLTKAMVKVKSNQAITVKGLAEKSIMSDLGIWSCSIATMDINPTISYDQLQRSINKVKEYLVNQGIKPESITVSSVNTFKEFKVGQNGARTNEVSGYNMSVMISTQSSDVNLIAKISSESTALLREGISIISNPPQFFYTKINDLKISILGEAAQDAKMRAEQLAKSTGSKIGTIKSANQGVFQITEPNSTEVSDYGENNSSSIKKSVKAVVTIEFFVE